MGKDPAFLFYPGDYLRDTQTMSDKTQVAYDRMMCEHMRNICITQEQISFFTKRLNKKEVEELLYVLVEVEGGFQIEWVADSIKKRRAYSESRRKNRSGIQEKVSIKTSQSYDSHMEIENEIENINEDKDEIRGGAGGDDLFDNFWNLYDKKIDRSSCEKKWRKLPVNIQHEILDKVNDYVKSTPEKRYRKNPLTYIINKSWKDEIVSVENKLFKDSDYE